MNNGYRHPLSEVLHFDDALYGCIDEAINLFFETYVSIYNEYAEMVIHKPKNEIDIYSIDEQHLLNFIKYAISLVDGGLFPDVLEIFLKNAYEVILDTCKDINKKKLLRIQLLYVIKSISLIHMGNIGEYLNFTGQIASEKVDMGKIHKHFSRR